MKISLQHIHLVSPNKLQLADWYCRNLGFTIIEDLEARGEPNGPVLITSDKGLTGLSIFTSSKNDNTSLPAFGVDTATFVQLHGKFSAPRIYDHYHFLSFYVKDGDGNKLEICCLEYDALKAVLGREQAPIFLMTPETYQGS